MSHTAHTPVVLVVLDGWGLRDDTAHNGVALARTPWFDHLRATYPFTTLEASGEAVGLPSGQMGNSEVGHTTIGIGCVLYQDLVRITKDITDGRFAHNPAFTQLFAHTKTHASQLHIMGLLSTGGVHSHEDHFLATIDAALAAKVERIVLHVFLDGRDTPKTSGVSSLKRLEQYVSAYPRIHIGSVAGRYYAMDRDTNWQRTDAAVAAIFEGTADHVYSTAIRPSQIIQERYHADIFDELMEPMVFETTDGRSLQVEDHDALIFTNFRKDRARQLSQRICAQTTDRDLLYVTMTDYGSDIQATIAYKPEDIQTTLGETIARAGLKQVHIAETEKYPHATFYLNGGRETPYDGEEDVLIPSRKDIKTHDEAPEMRAKEITDAAIERLADTDFMFINYANPDMVGHTANEAAIITAIETVDTQLQQLTQEILQHGGTLVCIADHGNAEMMVDPTTGDPHTSHTTNPVPCIIVSQHPVGTLRPGGSLQDIAPTVLELMGLNTPKSMTGESVIEKKE